MNWGLPTSVEIGGESYEIRTDFRVILDIFVMLSDPDLSGTDRAEGILQMFYVSPEDIPPQHLQEAVDAFSWFQNGGQTNTGGVHWWTFLGAYQDLGDCTFAQVVRIRDKKARGKLLEKDEREWYRRNSDIVNMKRRLSQAEDTTFSKWLGVGKEPVNGKC